MYTYDNTNLTHCLLALFSANPLPENVCALIYIINYVFIYFQFNESVYSLLY